MHAPIVGQIVADLICGRSIDGIDISSLQSSRFDNQPTVAELTGF
tara:strand:+ start:584 stop:718 length:135 start_codon:yes stop_codon:yes gene_type:complete